MSENGELPKREESPFKRPLDYEPDINPYEAQRQRKKEIGKKRTQTLTTPLKTPGSKPWNTEMVRQRKDGSYRTVDQKTGKIIG